MLKEYEPDWKTIVHIKRAILQSMNNILFTLKKHSDPIFIPLQVERVEVNGVLNQFFRGCVEKCPWGCRFNGYGLTKVTCNSCCSTNLCNTGNSAINLKIEPCLLFLLFFIKT